MAPKVFITGVTGYIGGDVLYAIEQAHPDWSYTCLVRTPDKGAKVAAVYPKIRLVYGDLDSADLLEEEAGKADIVIHTADCDHVPAAEAFEKAARKRSASNPLYFLHTSGTGILTWESDDVKVNGKELPRVYDDWEGIKELTSLPDFAPHRPVDKVILRMSSADPEAVKTAIICPPCIHGTGRGPANQRSQQAYEAAKVILQTKTAISPLGAENIWHEVNVQDLSNLYVIIAEAAAAGGGKATWNENGYYFAENGSFAWKEVFQGLASIAKKKDLIDSDQLVKFDEEQLAEVHPQGLHGLVGNSRGKAIRARKLFGWQPHGQSLLDELPQIVEGEAKGLGLIKGHAAKVVQ